MKPGVDKEMSSDLEDHRNRPEAIDPKRPAAVQHPHETL